MRWTWIVLVLAACGMSEDKFQEQYNELSCEKMIECAEEDTGSYMLFDNVDDCITFMGFVWTMIPDDCDYNKKAAKQCIKDTKSATCDDMAGDGPSSCADVYDGDCMMGSTTSE